jgi:hypothetical protein
LASNQVSKGIPRNPYFHRSAIKDPDCFFGRAREIDKILSHTTAGESVSIVGPRRIGKTSLLFYLRHSAQAAESGSASRHLFVFLDCQRKPRPSQLDIYQWIWSETLKEAEQVERLPGGLMSAIEELPNMVQSAEEFEKAVNGLCAAGFELTLLLDEFELMAENPQLNADFFTHLRGLTVAYPVGYVTSSTRTLSDLEYSDRSVLSSPFFNVFHQQRLGFLKRGEARDLIVKPVQDIQDFPAYTQGEIAFLFDLAGYHPAFLQMACYHLFERKVAGGEWSDWAAGEVRQKFEDEIVGHFRYAWKQLTPSEKEAMMLICTGRADEVSRQLWTELEHQCLACKRKLFSSTLAGFILREFMTDLMPEGRLPSRIRAASHQASKGNRRPDAISEGRISQMKATVQIFLCYAEKDAERVEDLYRKLFDEGFKPWMDEKDILPGEVWEDAIKRAIRSSNFFLACLSPNSVNRRGQIQKEIKRALGIWEEKLVDDIYLIPVRLEECDVPDSLCRFQWVDLFEAGGWTRLVKAIRVGIERWAKAA